MEFSLFVQDKNQQDLLFSSMPDCSHLKENPDMLCFEIILIEQMVIVKKEGRNIDAKILELLKTYYEGF